MARHAGSAIRVNKIAAERNVKPVALFAFDAEFVAVQ
jgi:hypothetical protein